jgi:hypothetical protein
MVGKKLKTVLVRRSISLVVLICVPARLGVVGATVRIKLKRD